MNVMIKLSMTLKWLQICVLVLFTGGTLLAQEDVKIRKKDFRTGVDIGFKEAWESLREGNRYFSEGKGTFDLARDLFLYANQYNSEHAGLNYKIGCCYLFTDDKYQAIDYLKKAYQLDEDVSEDINYMLAQAYHLVLEFDDAIRHYNLHKETLKGEELESYTETLAKRLSECQYGKTISKDPVRVIIQNLGEEINSRYDDYNPVFAEGDSALFFTSRRPEDDKSKRNPLDNKFYEDIFIAPATSDGFSDARRMGKLFNTDKNDALVGISADGKELYIYRGGEIHVTSFDPEKSRWSRPKSLPSRLLSDEGETSACLSGDGKELYFVSANEKLTRGGKDIFVSRLDEKGKWSEPANLGNMVNSKYDEEGVFISPNGRHLYFASRGHSSMGGYDIFRSERLENGGWSTPENLGYPINTPDDEVFYVTGKSGIFGYYSAIRQGGLGAKDLFKVIYLGSEKELVTATHDRLIAGPGDRLTGFLQMPDLPVLDTFVVLTGQVLDTLEGMEPVMAHLSFLDPTGTIPEVNAMTDESGFFTVRLPEPTVYGIEINATGYLYFLDLVDLLGETGDRKIVRDFYLQRLEVGTKVVLENIYFETGKAVLRPESFDALDQVLRFLENNPDIRLEISGHTDNTGSLRINERLSRDRAKAVVDYLIAGGIPEEMLVYRGYADSQPVAPNDTPEGREKNRRVEFKVLSK